MKFENRDFASISSERTAAAVLALHVQIEWTAYQALEALELQADTSPLQRAKGALADRAPCYVDEIRIVGEVWRDEYDEQPGLAWFTEDASQDYEVPPYCTVAKAMELAVPIFEGELAKHRRQSNPRDGEFSPTGICLVSSAGHVLQRYRDGKWEELPAYDSWAELESRACGLDSQAWEEERWENHESGRTLRKKAADLRQIVKMAQLAQRHGH